MRFTNLVVVLGHIKHSHVVDQPFVVVFGVHSKVWSGPLPVYLLKLISVLLPLAGR